MPRLMGFDCFMEILDAANFPTHDVGILFRLPGMPQSINAEIMAEPPKHAHFHKLETKIAAQEPIKNYASISRHKRNPWPQTEALCIIVIY